MNSYPLFGAGCLSSSPEVFHTRVALMNRGVSYHTQLMIIPEQETIFRERLDLYSPYSGLIRIHAPHHKQNVNPCDPPLYSEDLSVPVSQHIETAMQQTLEAADVTKSPFIVLHAGRYLPGEEAIALQTFHEFLDMYPDRRYILETLPILGTKHQFLGVTPDQLIAAADNRIRKFCFDFPHIFCTSQHLRIPYDSFLRSFEDLTCPFAHLSGTPGTDTEKQHLTLDDPDNILPVPPVVNYLKSHSGLEVSIELALDDPYVIERQIEIATTLFS